MSFHGFDGLCIQDLVASDFGQNLSRGSIPLNYFASATPPE